jgi:beta-N-acetylhexosaminidase
VILSADKPYDVQLYPDADAVMAIYGYKGSEMTGMPQLVHGSMTETMDTCGPNIVAGAEVAFGVFGASGKLPVNIPVYDAKTKEYKSELVFKRGFGISYKKLDPPANLKKASVKSLKAGKRKLKVTMTTKPKSKGGTKYQVAYKIKSKKKWKYKTTSKKTLTIKKLKAKKRYKVRVRVCKKVNGKMQYGAWSKTKTSKKIK